MTASTVVLSYPADLSGWGRDQLETPWFTAYLRRSLGDVAPGETHAAFLDVGCCGDTLDVPLRVEHVDGEGAVGADTAVEFEERAPGDLAGGWLVQSRAGPSGGR